MNKKYIVYVMLCLSIPQPLNTTTEQNIFVLGCRPCGLFSNFNAVINHLDWCLRNNKTLVVYWDSVSAYYAPDGHNGSSNVWEYYFEPISNAHYQPGLEIHRSCNPPDGVRIIKYQSNPEYNPDYELRKTVHTNLIAPYIKVKQTVQDKVDKFFNKHMRGKHTIGIHLRGTDKYKEIAQVPTEDILNMAQSLATPDSQFFVATDEYALLEQAQQTLQGQVLYYDAHRSHDSTPIHHTTGTKALLGQEVLIEVLLMSKCDAFVHTCSSVSTAVLLFNPELKNVLLTP